MYNVPPIFLAKKSDANQRTASIDPDNDESTQFIPDAILRIRTRAEIVILGPACFLKNRYDQR